MSAEQRPASIGHNTDNAGLSRYALEIRDLLSTYDNTEGAQKNRRIEIGKLLLEVKQKFFPLSCVQARKGVTMAACRADEKNFKLWQTENITSKFLGERPYSLKTLSNYMVIALNPDKDKKEKKEWQQRAHNDAKKYRKIIKNFPSADTLAVRSDVPIHDQINLLVSVWERTTDEARNQFIHLVNLRYV